MSHEFNIGPAAYRSPRFLRAGQRAGGATTTALRKNAARKASKVGKFLSKSDPTYAYGGAALAAAGWKKRNPIRTETGDAVRNLNPFKDHEVAHQIGLETGKQLFEFSLNYAKREPNSSNRSQATT
tara:strand:- start:396 stop:773 length:378 start_codon:yes stop_codon:yes gene_type:complete